MYANNYFNIERFDKVIAKIRRCTFLTRCVILLTAVYDYRLLLFQQSFDFSVQVKIVITVLCCNVCHICAQS